MFLSVDFPEVDQLKALVSDSRKALNEKKVEITYPEQLKTSRAAKSWKEHYKEIDQLNKDILKSIDKRGGVYAIFAAKPDKEWARS